MKPTNGEPASAKYATGNRSDIEEITLTQAVEAITAEVRMFPLTLNPDVTIYFDQPDLAIRETFMTCKEKASASELFNRLEEIDDEHESLHNLAVAEIQTQERFSFIVGIIMGLVMAGKSSDDIKSIVEAYLRRFTEQKESTGSGARLKKGIL